MSKIKNIEVNEKDDDMFLSCNFDDTKNQDETEKVYAQLAGNSAAQDNWSIIHDKLLIRLVKKDDKFHIEFKETNNPKGIYGRPMVLNILPAYLLERDIIDKAGYDFITSSIVNAEVTKTRVGILNTNKADFLNERKNIMNSLRK